LRLLFAKIGVDERYGNITPPRYENLARNFKVVQNNTAMKRELGPLRGQTYDEFFSSKSPVSRLQFAGLLVLGGALVTCGVSLVVMILSNFPFASLDFTAAIILVACLCVPIAIIYFGVLHIRRAFANGR
jgi:hypothetical protein